jgi:hypothetical protein
VVDRARGTGPLPEPYGRSELEVIVKGEGNVSELRDWLANRGQLIPTFDLNQIAPELRDAEHVWGPGRSPQDYYRVTFAREESRHAGRACTAGKRKNGVESVNQAAN